MNRYDDEYNSKHSHINISKIADVNKKTPTEQAINTSLEALILLTL